MEGGRRCIIQVVFASYHHSRSGWKKRSDVYEASWLPEKVAIGYRAMYAHGIHLRICEAEKEKVTFDSRVAAAVWRRSGSRNVHCADEVETAEYVGWVEEILELNYRRHSCIVLVCSWIPGDLGMQNAKV
jgi:hypothetical protein